MNSILKLSSDLLLKAVEVMGEGVIVIDSEMRILYLNSATEAILGRTEQELAGKNLCEAVCCRQADGFQISMETCKEYRQVVCKGSKCQHNVFFTHNDGTLIPVSLSAVPLCENGKTAAAVVTLRQTTENNGKALAKRSVALASANKALQNALAEHETKERKLEAHVEALQKASKEIEHLKFAIDQHSIVAVMDREGAITYANDKFCEISQYRRGELLGQDHRILNSGKHSPEFFKGMWAVIGRGEVWKGEVLNRSKDGSLYWVDTTVVPFLDEQGIPYQYVEICTDVTERKHVEDEIRCARDAAIEALKVKSEFLATMSHEIRTPMNGIIGVAELLLRTPLPDEIREYVKIIGNSADTLMHTLNDILDFSKLESGKIEIDASDFDLLAIVDFSIDLLAPRAYEKSLQLLSFIDPHIPPFLSGDAGRLRQILLNLISNAIKFTAEGEIIVRAIQESQTDTHIHVYFEIIDTGIGVSPSELKRLFQPFTQADGSTTRQYGGTGLGLIITKRLVELMGGEIGVRSEKGRGSTFWFRLPFKRSKAAREQNHRFQNIGRSRVKMLIADRSPASRGIFETYMTLWGVECACVADGKGALEFIRQAASANAPFGIAFLDATLMDIDVFSLAQAIMEAPAIQSTRLVLLSPAANKHGEAARALKAGFEACYIKPLKQSELLDSIESLANWRDRPSSPKKFIRSGHYRVQGHEIIEPAPPGLISLGRPSRHEKILSIQNLADAPTGLRSQHPLLVVEDHGVNRLITKKQLEEFGLCVEVASNGKEAVTCFQHKTYALILMDCQMPLMDGFEATAKIREIEAQRASAGRVPIIALTASISESDWEGFIAAGMDDYLFKPVKLEKLRETLRHWLNNSPTEAAESADVAIKPAVEVLDYKALDELRCIMGQDFGEIVDIFLDETPGLINALRESVRQGQVEMLYRTAHKIKSASANLGTNGLSLMARELETKGRAGDMAGAAANVVRLESEYRRVSQELAAYHRRHLPVSPPPAANP